MMIFEHTPPGWVLALALSLAALLGLFSAWRYAPRTVGTGLIALCHLLFLGALAWCLLIPGRRTSETHALKPRFVIALDTSKSMALRATDQIPDRWTRAQEALSLPWVKSLAAQCEFDVYTFDAEVGRKMELKETGGLAPAGESTLLRDAIQKITGRYAGVNIVGGLLLTDGSDTREALPDWANEPRPFPLYTVALEPPAVWKVEPDLRVDAVQTPRRVSVNWETELTAVISGTGTEGRSVNAALYKDGVLQQEAPIQIPQEGGTRQVVFNLAHPEIGVFTYRIAVAPLPGESNTNDNEFSVMVQVVDNKNRLIYVEGPPRWESKYLKRALQANRQATPLIFLQGPEGKPLILGQVGTMTADLTDQQLSYFKIVIVGNLDAGELGPARARSLIKFVENGGSLVLLGGTKGWGAKGFATSELKNILPARGYRNTPEEGEFRVAITSEGKSHAAFAGEATLWERIPPVLSVYSGATLQPAASTLVTADTPAGPQPIVVSQPYGQGKVIMLLTDSLWKWQLHPSALETKPYQRFWDQMIAWLMPKETEVEQDRLEISTDKETLAIGEELQIRARLGGDHAGREVNTRCEIQLPDGTKAPFTLRPETVTTASGKAYPGFATTYKALQPGLHQVVATATFGGQAVTSDPISFTVKSFSPETAPRPADTEVLRRIASASGGRHFDSLEALNDALSELSVKQVEEELSEYESLWQKPALLATLLALAAVSWIIRKVNNMP